MPGDRDERRPPVIGPTGKPGGGAPVAPPEGAAPAASGKGGTLKETERVRAGGPFGSAMVGGKAESFGPSANRLVRRLRPQRLAVFGVIAMAVAAVALGAIGPRVLGRATDLIFGG